VSSSEFLAIVRLAVKGAQTARKDIETFRNGIMETGKAAGLSRKEMDALDKTISKGAASQRQAAQASKQSNDNKKRESAQTRKLRDELERLNNQYKRTQQQLLSRGGDPSAAVGRFSQDELKRIVALNQVYPQYGREVAKAAREALRLAEAKQKANQAMKQTEGATKNYGSSLPRLRYALYDVSQTAALMGAALAGIGTAVLKTAVDFERSFAEVIRTTGVTGDEVDKLRKVFEDLNTELPVSFQELAAVGKLAGQLGIPTADIENFTRLVVQFSETTGIAVEDAATAFGRLSALLGLTGDQFDNLGSSILKAGTSFVATEADIIAIATQLAGIGRQAGLTADQVVGLSTALASVGIAPELARGVITRTFGRIGQAVAAGGSRLNDFATIAGMSSEQFATAWRDDASGAFLAFTRGISARGGEAEAALAALGITSVRDVPALLRLAQTSESILAPALGVAAKGFEEGTELADQYGIIAGTTAEQLNRLQQNVQQLFAELAKGVLVFSPAIESISSVVKALRSIAQVPVVGFLSSMVIAATALSGVFLIALGGAIRFAASLLAVRTSLTELNAVTDGQRVTLRNLVVEAFRASTGMQKLSGSQTKLSASTFKATTDLQKKNAALFQNGQLTSSIAMKQMGLAGAMDQGAKSTDRKARALKGFGAALKGIGWLVALDAAFKLINSFEKMREASAEAASQLSEYANGLTEFADANEVASAQVEILANGIENQMGWISQAVMKLNELFGLDAEFFALKELEMGRGSAERFSESLVSIVEQGKAVEALDIASAMVRQLEEAGLRTDIFIDSLRELNPEIAAVLEGSSRAGLEILRMDQAHASAAFSAMDQAEQIAFLTDEMMALVTEAYAVVNAEAAMEDALDKLGEAFARNGAEVEANGQAIQKVVGLIIEQAQGDVPQAVANIQALYDTLISEGIAYADQLVIIKQIQADLLATVSGGIPGALNAKGGAGFTTEVRNATIQTNALRNSWQNTRAEIEASATAARRTGRNTASAARETERQARATREVQKEVRTLIDYARDLSRVFSRAFDLRFKSQSELDKIADMWENISDNILKAEEGLAELQRTQNKLTSDRAIKEYFLSIADAYGDTLRSGVLRNELADIDAELASNAQDIANAQGESSRELEGNSKAARDNRSTITGLVSQYQSYIASLAESGMSQAQLRVETEKARKEFVEQARALGFAEADIQKYAAAFDDVATAINRVPRNVTIEADVNPAITALKELEAQQQRNIQLANDLNAAMGRAPSGGGGGGSGSVPSPSAPNNSAQRNELIRLRNTLQSQLGAAISERNRQVSLANNSSNPTQVRQAAQGRVSSLNNQIRSLEREVANVNNAIARLNTGGLVAGPGGKKSDSIPAMLSRGEFVVRASAVDKYGVDFLNSINQMRFNGGFGGGSSVTVNTPDAMMVELSPYDRALLQQAGNVELRLDGRVVAQTANRNNVASAQRGSN
jgi:TP901 family phage tail tape measure protein